MGVVRRKYAHSKHTKISLTEEEGTPFRGFRSKDGQVTRVATGVNAQLGLLKLKESEKAPQRIAKHKRHQYTLIMRPTRRNS